MIFKRKSRTASEPGGYIHVENQISHQRASGFGQGGHLKLEERGDGGETWTGIAQRNDDNTIYYRFRDSKGRTMTGLGDGSYVMLRDERGRSWKGFVE